MNSNTILKPEFLESQLHYAKSEIIKSENSTNICTTQMPHISITIIFATAIDNTIPAHYGIHNHKLEPL